MLEQMAPVKTVSGDVPRTLSRPKLSELISAPGSRVVPRRYQRRPCWDGVFCLKIVRSDWCLVNGKDMRFSAQALSPIRQGTINIVY
jgi:hypothetical protein